MVETIFRLSRRCKMKKCIAVLIMSAIILTIGSVANVTAADKYISLGMVTPLMLAPDLIDPRRPFLKGCSN